MLGQLLVGALALNQLLSQRASLLHPRPLQELLLHEELARIGGTSSTGWGEGLVFRGEAGCLPPERENLLGFGFRTTTAFSDGQFVDFLNKTL